MKFLLTLLAFTAPAAAFAASDVTIDSKVMVEHQTQDPSGKLNVTLDPPKVVTPGDRLVFVVTYKNGGTKPATDFVITNPIPNAVAFTSVEDGSAVVSVDGGKTWGPLATLKVTAADGQVRSAQAGDVTHVRWALAAPIPAGQGGKFSFRGVVK